MVEGAVAPPRFRGRPVDGPDGESLVRRLARRSLPILQRSIRYHRPRAPFCGVGQCTQCLVRVNGVPNVRACRYVPAPGDRIETENAWPSPRWDVLGLLDPLFPRGIDTLHGFRRPAWATPLYHWVVRRLAGYGRPPDPVRPPSFPSTSERVETEALVIGAGPSGREAAHRLASGGVATLLLDRGDPGPPVEGATTRPGASVVFLPPPSGSAAQPFTAVVDREGAGAMRVRARHVVVATGGYDGPLLFAGSDRPGVLSAEGAIAIAPTEGAPPFRRAVVFGGGPRVVPLLDRFGSHIDAVVAPGSIQGGVVERASALEIPMYPRTMLLSASGRSRVRSLRLRTRGGAPEFSLACDAVVLAHRRLPNPQLYYQAGARMRWHGSTGAYYPELGPSCRTSVEGLYGVGEAAGFVDEPAARSSGAAAADAILGRPWEAEALPSRVPVEGPGELEGYYQELLHGARPRAKWIVCPCEDVLLSEIEEASRRGFRGIEVIKRLTGVGTGLCQGRYCLPDALLLLAQFEGRAPSEIGYITQRPPVFPTPLEALAVLPGPTGGDPT